MDNQTELCYIDINPKLYFWIFTGTILCYAIVSTKDLKDL